MGGARIMLVPGEAGEEFYKAFFDQKLTNKMLKRVEGPRSLDPSELYQHIKSQADLLIADVGLSRKL